MKVIVGCAISLLGGFAKAGFGNYFAATPMSKLGVLRQKALVI